MFGFKKKKEKQKVLVIEDDALLANILLARLDSNGFDSEGVANGLDAMDATKKYKPDIILLDLILPGLDGFAILKELKDNKETAKIPVFILSNLDDLADVKSTKALGAEEYFIKANIELDKVIEAIGKRLK